jgi:uncharacterized OB-fold protein
MTLGLKPQATPITEPFWEAARAGELHMQFCLDCEKPYFYPRSFCPHCGGRYIEWRKMSGRGRVLSTVVSRRGLPSIQQDLPLIIALIELDEGPHLMSNIVDTDVERPVELDSPVEVCFRPREEFMLPMFTLVAAES